MVRAWFLEGDGSSGNPRDEHQQLPPKFISLENLESSTGIQYQEMNLATYQNDGSLDKLKNGQPYNYVDYISTPDATDSELYYTEHFFEDEQMRLVVEGCGYYDVRDKNEEWIRIEVMAGDLIVIPSGCYHRFTVDNQNFYRARRFYQKPFKMYERPAENMTCRREYVKKISGGVFHNFTNNKA